MDAFLLAAIEEAERGLSEGGIPIGSVLVHSGVIVSRGHNPGLDPSLLKKMLPLLAMLVSGYMAKLQCAGAVQTSQAGGGLRGLLGGLLGGQGAGSATQGVAAPGLASMFDLDGDGNPLDDILEMARKAIT